MRTQGEIELASLTEKTVRELPAPERGNKVHYFAGAVLQGAKAPRGLGVRVTAAGAKSFVLNYRIGRREFRYTIGQWPDWSVLKAVKEARELRQRVDRGENPLADRAPPAATDTVAEMLDEFLKRHVRDNLRSASYTERTIERLIKPRIGKLGIYEFRRLDVVRMLDEIADERGPVMADRTLAILRKACNWHATRDEEFDPPIVKGMARTKPKERKRKRNLADSEIREVWASLESADVPACYPAYVKSLLLTATRRSEAAKMNTIEIEGDLWTVPGERYKTKLDHVIPLTAQARALIGSKPEGFKGNSWFVFSSTGGGKPFSGFSKAKKALDAEIAARRAADNREPMPRWTLHDLRRTARSLMSRAKVSADHAERVLGHVIGGVRETYDRHEYLEEKREALAKLAAMIDRILNPAPSNVATLDEHRAARRP